MLYPMVADRGDPTGSELADTLREVAALLDGLGDVPISPAAVVRHLEQEMPRRSRGQSRSS
ncbi:hypothetical protein ACFY2R_10460 [Micromonospora olivasterospora]|uniref:Uncharacterized protein n=1 Tax=Micromonospora olivasterospora TaxID=1880 RepID=A0A562I9P0_MICOL|nr:hypothetical protein [Micromonospora olivasterospora]TWH67498.1 hypothetical protein JD77_02475 [Micromonospora olivasterospora]